MAVKIGLVGTGTVGGGCIDIIQKHKDDFLRHFGVDIELARVCSLSSAEAAAHGVGHLFTDNFNNIINDPEIDIVVELIGGTTIARTVVLNALAAGKNVVTANKALMATHGKEVMEAAEAAGKELAFEASVGGGIPIIDPLKHSLIANELPSVMGIVNGTTNFIMDAMHKSPVDFPAILKEAQDLGYAEADPSADIDGDDIRRKLCISANIAFDAVLEETAIPTFGIRTVTAEDIAAFKAHGFVCKLLAAAESTENGVCAYVEPTLVDAGEPEAAVPANYNLITCTAERVGRQSFFGQGAGRFPTASNVVQDCLTILSGDKSFYTGKADTAQLDGSAEAHPYYVRTAAPDDFLRSVTADHWGAGVVTSAVNTYAMLAWARRQLAADPACFIAGIR